MPRRRNNKRNKNKKQEYKVIKIDKDHPPPKDLLHQWLVDGDMKPLSLMVELNWCHLINEPYKYRNDQPPKIMFLLLCSRDDLPLCSIEWMIENGADLRAKDEYGNNAMHWACIGKAGQVVGVLGKSREKYWLMHEPDGYGNPAIQLIRECVEEYYERHQAEEDAPFAEAVPIVEGECIVEAEAIVEE